MQASSIFSLLVVPYVAAHNPVFQARQTNSTGVPSRVESGISTECKTCPYSLCTNKAAYEYSQDLTLSCWTRGDTIVETDIWYETTDDCYVTEWDIIDGNYTDVLPYCGEVAETYTQGPSRTIFNTECNIIPAFVGEQADHTKMYKPDIDLTLTCRTIDGVAVLDNTVWYKTLSNCYVPEAQIEFVGKMGTFVRSGFGDADPRIDSSMTDADLDDCGPIPFMEAKMRQPDLETTSIAAFTTRDALHDKRWLYLTQIGEDSADCLAEANSASQSQKTYTFGDYIVVQCATRSVNTADDNLIFLLTEDFCWVNDTLTDPQLIDDEARAERYPNCNLFTDTEV